MSAGTHPAPLKCLLARTQRATTGGSGCFRQKRETFFLPSFRSTSTYVRKGATKPNISVWGCITALGVAWNKDDPSHWFSCFWGSYRQMALGAKPNTGAG